MLQDFGSLQQSFLTILQVASLSSLNKQLETERSNLLKLAANGKKVEELENRAKLLEEEKQRQLQRAEKSEQGEAAQRKLVVQVRLSSQLVKCSRIFCLARRFDSRIACCKLGQDDG